MNYKIVAVDFDNTLCEENYPFIGTPNYKALRIMLQFKHNGGKIILWTCRSGQALKEAVDFCSDNFLELDAINENEPGHLKEWLTNHPESEIGPKPYADMYIDDKGNTGIDWDAIDNIINKKWKEDM
jgi:hydroxymethylpyrimidine pyrophosphatase-like HAD family hydrolase